MMQDGLPEESDRQMKRAGEGRGEGLAGEEKKREGGVTDRQVERGKKEENSQEKEIK